MELRPYQIEARDAVWEALFESNTALLVLSTGTGKTETIFGFCLKALEARPDIKILFAVNRVSLVEQTLKRAADVIPDVGAYCGSLNVKDDKPFTIASVQSIYKKKELPKYDLIIFDEAHRINTTEGSQYQNIISRSPQAKIVGMTATPFRNDGYIYGPDKLFSKIHYSHGLDWAIDNGWLVVPSLKHVDKQFDTSKLRTRMGDFDSSQVAKLTNNENFVREQVQDALSRSKDRKKIIWHCSNIDHAELVAKKIPEPTSIIHSKMTKLDKEKNLKAFEKGLIRHLVFVMIVSEGYDFPPIDTVILMRPTKSALVYVQCVGRALRNSPGKKDCLVLDYGQVVKNCGPLNDPHIPQKGNGVKSTVIPMKFCPECYEYVPSNTAECPACKFDFVAAKLKEQKAYMEGLTARPDLGSSLIAAKPTRDSEWIKIDPSRCRAYLHESAIGNKCVKFSFGKAGSFIKRFHKYIVIESKNPRAYKGRASADIYKIMKSTMDFKTAQEYVDKINSIGFDNLTEIRVDQRGKWPDVVGFKHAG
jgi:DNA repair protein RadD